MGLNANTNRRVWVSCTLAKKKHGREFIKTLKVQLFNSIYNYINQHITHFHSRYKSQKEPAKTQFQTHLDANLLKQSMQKINLLCSDTASMFFLLSEKQKGIKLTQVMQKGKLKKNQLSAKENSIYNINRQSISWIYGFQSWIFKK